MGLSLPWPLRYPMGSTITITLTDAESGGTEVVGIHEGLPPGVPVADNETGGRMALDKLAALLEREQ